MKNRFLSLAFGFLLSALLTAQAQTPSTATTAKPAAKQNETAPSAKIDPAKEADIRRLLEVTGVKTIVAQTVAGMTDNIRPVLRQSFPPGDYRDKLIDLFLERFQAKVGVEELMSLSIPIYDKYFSQEEIRSMIRFYETPLGQKTIQVLPQLMEEMRKKGEELGSKLGEQAMTEVLAEHPDLAEAIEKAGKSKQP